MSYATLFSRIRVPRLVAALVLTCVSAVGLAKTPATPVRFEEVARSALFVPLYVALNQGYFKDEGLDVSMKTSQGTDKGMIALLSGNADIVMIGPEASIYVLNSESPTKPRVFAGLIGTDGFMLMSREPAASFDWAKIKGKTILSYRPGSNPQIFLEQALKKHGVDPTRDVKFMGNIARPARAAAWSAGQADYAIFDEPEASNLEAAGHGHVITSVGYEVGQVDYTVFTATTTFLKEHPEVAHAWTRAIRRAMKHVASAPAQELAQQVSSYFQGLSTAELVNVIERYRKYGVWKTEPTITPEAISKLQDMLVEGGQLDANKRVAYDRLVASEFAAEASK